MASALEEVHVVLEGGRKPASDSLHWLCLPKAGRDLWAEASLNCAHSCFKSGWNDSSSSVTWQSGGCWQSPADGRAEAHQSASQIPGGLLCQSQGWRKCKHRGGWLVLEGQLWGSETLKGHVWQSFLETAPLQWTYAPLSALRVVGQKPQLDWIICHPKNNEKSLDWKLLISFRDTWAVPEAMINLIKDLKPTCFQETVSRQKSLKAEFRILLVHLRGGMRF